MCPQCGCPGDIIRASATNRAGKTELPAVCHALVKIETDRTAGVGVCIEDAGQRYVLTSQSLLSGAQSLSVVKLPEGVAVPYTAIELASDRDLARLAVQSTNLQPIAIGKAESAGLALVHRSDSNTVALLPTGAAGKLPAGTPLLDAASNVVMTTTDAAGRHAEALSGIPGWIVVQPLVYRTQSALLLRAADAAGAKKVEQLKELETTRWLTPFLAQQAAALIAAGRQEGNNP